MNDLDQNNTRPASPLEHLVRRLRNPSERTYDVGSCGVVYVLADDTLLDEAAREIERLASQKEEAIRIADQALAHSKEMSAALKCLIGATEPMASRERQVHAITMAVAALRGL